MIVIIFMKIVILSDDLTGASGVASMINSGRTVTLNYEKLQEIYIDQFDYVSINLNLRNVNEATARKVMEKILPMFEGRRIALRIDSTLRGNIPVLVRMILKTRRALITDTIPEYGRYTENGKTVYNGEEKSIYEALELGVKAETKNELVISDSRTSIDLDNLAKLCLDNNLVPIDPGPMIAKYALKLCGNDEL